MKQTTLQEVRQLAAANPEAKMIPIARILFSDIRTPLEVLRALMNVDEHCFILESAEDKRNMGRYTFVGYDPSMELICKDHELTVNAGGTIRMHTEHPGQYIKQIVSENRSVRLPGLPPFTGGLVGYFSYDYIKYAEPTLKLVEGEDDSFRDMDLMLFDKLICFDHYDKKIFLIANVKTNNIEQNYNKALIELDNMENLIRHGEQKNPEPGHMTTPLTLKFNEEEYCEKVEKTKHYIREGDIFQLVLSNPMTADYKGSLYNCYRVLRTTNPSPYMFYFAGQDVEIAGASPETLVKVEDGVIRTFPLAGTRPRGKTEEEVEKTKHYIREGDIFQLVLSNPMTADYKGSLYNCYRVLRTTNPSPYMFYFAGQDVEIAGASPETLVKVEDGVIRTFPLAGTRPRGKTEEEDKALEKGLLTDEKERAEHNMLVDLGRNDLGKLCEFGSVKVEKYMEIERYSHVMHIGSCVVGKLTPDKDAVDAVDAALPAGTLSGAPKIRACELINELEGDKRGLYGGAVGYIDFTGNLDVCIAIRLAFKHSGKVVVRTGAGIVADSVPENEFVECRNKAAAVVQALNMAEEMDDE